MKVTDLLKAMGDGGDPQLSPKELAGMSMDLAIMTLDPALPKDFVVKNGDKWVNGRVGQTEYLTDDLSKAMRLAEPIADALIDYLSLPCDCGSPACEYPKAEPTTKHRHADVTVVGAVN